MPFYSNEEIKNAKPGYEPAWIDAKGLCHPPKCCGADMADNGGCLFGCCDYYKCNTCGHTTKIEWPD